MLYKLDAKLEDLEPLPFYNFGDFGKKEKHLEKFLADNLFEILYSEGERLLPFHQEKPFEPVADIFALNECGDVVIFELKLREAGSGALDQLLRYVEDAGRWQYAELNSKHSKYMSSPYKGLELKEAHQEAFLLDSPLEEHEFNREQRMWVVGSAANDDLRARVDFWKNKGLAIDFMPYRIFMVGENHYFEFFAKPYDIRSNPRERKGIIFDTNRSWDVDPQKCASFKWMIEKNRVSAFGDRKDAVQSFRKNDYVFYSHRWSGVAGAAKITGSKIQSDLTPNGWDELHWDVELLTKTPTDFANPPAISSADVQRITGKTFFWARILKVPYLSKEESENLVKELQKKLGTP